MKFNRLFITDLKRTDDCKNSLKNNKQSRISKSIEENTLKSEFPSRNNKYFNDTKYSMIEYLINEETQFVDLFKCQEYYEQISHKYHSSYNVNQNDLIKKKNKIKELDNLIATVYNIYIKRKSFLISTFKNLKSTFTIKLYLRN